MTEKMTLKELLAYFENYYGEKYSGVIYNTLAGYLAGYSEDFLQAAAAVLVKRVSRVYHKAPGPAEFEKHMDEILSEAQKHEQGRPGTFYYRICPRCKAKAHIDRIFCKCLFDLRETNTAYAADNDTGILPPVNVATPETNCERCGLKCGWCYSFSVNQKNSAGYGGKNCEHASGASPRCLCCLELMRRFDEELGRGGNVPVDYSRPFLDTVAFMRDLCGLAPKSA